jgi:hypothetical protein
VPTGERSNEKAMADPAPTCWDIPHEQWMAMSGRVVVTWSIFNPNGPTLSCLGWIYGHNDTAHIFYRWLHFLGGETWHLGDARTSEAGWTDRALEIFWRANSRFIAADLPPPFHGIPSLVSLPHPDRLGPFVQDLLKAAPGVRGEDWGHEAYYLRKHGDQLFARAGEEIREAVERIKADPSLTAEQRAEAERLHELRFGNVPTFAGSPAPNYQSAAFSEGLFSEWWEAVTAPGFIGSALLQLAQAWVGAIHILQSTGRLDAYRTSGRFTPFEHVRDFLARFAHPLWPDDLSTATLMQGLGIDAPPTTAESPTARQPSASGRKNAAAADADEIAWTPMFESEPERFKAIVNTPEMEARAGAYPTLADALLGEIVHYGIMRDEAFIPALRSLYRGCIEQGVPARSSG